MNISPLGPCKNVMRLLVTALLISSVLEPVINMDFEGMALDKSEILFMEETFLQKLETTQENINKAVIEQQYKEYILDKALEFGLGEIDVSLKIEHDSNGYCAATVVEISGSWTEEQKKALESLLETELGITKERQIWHLV